MKNTHFIFLIDDSAYRPMYEAMLADAAGLDNVTILADTPNNNRTKELLQKNKVRKLSRGCLDWLAYEKNALYHTLDKLCPVWDQVVVVCFNAAFKWNPYVAGTLKHYKRIWKNLKYVLFYLDLYRNADGSLNPYSTSDSLRARSPLYIARSCGSIACDSSMIVRKSPSGK